MALKRRLLLAGLIAGGVALLLFLAVLSVPITLTPSVRHRLVAALNERFDANVELASLKVTVLPRARVDGQGVVLRHKKGAADLPPLIIVKSFTAEASLWGLIGSPLRLKRVHLDGLEINIPPGGLKIGDKEGDAKGDEAKAADAKAGGAQAGGAKGQEAAKAGAKPAAKGAAKGAKGAADTQKAASDDDLGKPPVTAMQAPVARPVQIDAKPAPLVIDEILAEHASLRILRREAGKAPRTFEIHALTMQAVGDNIPWAFRAQLTNPTPPGQIETRGTFGPWAAGDPASTPLEGEYVFKHADLGVFKGIGGILESTGRFGGMLQRIDVNGKATVPDFMLTIGGRPVPLETTFRSVVDGTNGNTWLVPVDAMLGRSPIHAEGGVVEETGQKGRTIALDVVMDKARIEDVLMLALKKTMAPPFTGQLQLKTKLRIPPGEKDVIDRMGLDGSFEIATARFASFDIQQKINELSRRARGKMDQPAQRVVSNMKGRYVMKNGVLRFSSVSFQVPGAAVLLAGSYTMRGEHLNFTGTVHLDAKLSQMTTGFKSVLLKAVDPLLRRKGDTVIPISIEGTAGDPKFKLDIKRTLLRR